MRTNTNIKGMKPTITGTITFDNSTTMSLVNTDFLAGSFCIKDGTSNSGEFTVGGAVIRGCSFTLLNDSGRFNNLNWFNSKVSITLTFPNNTTLMFSGFYVVSHKETGRRINVETYTAMKLLDEYEIYEHNFTYPTTASSAVGTIATARGLTVTGMAYPNMSIPDPGDDTLTEREFISYIAQMMGQFVTIEGTVMRFDWYDFTSTYNAGTTFSHDLRTSDVTITGVKVTANDGTTVATQGSSGYMLNITDNPLITASNASTVATQIYGAVNGITFRPGTVQIESNAAIEAGDVISVYTGRETVTMIATTLTYKTTLRESITADADPQDGDLRVTRSQRIAKTIQKEAVKTIDQQLADSTSPLSQAIASGGGGSTLNLGRKYVGGANNQYGQLTQFNTSGTGSTIDKDGIQIQNGGVETVKSGGTILLKSGAFETIENGGTLQGTKYYTTLSDYVPILKYKVTTGTTPTVLTLGYKHGDTGDDARKGINVAEQIYGQLNINRVFTNTNGMDESGTLLSVGNGAGAMGVEITTKQRHNTSTNLDHNTTTAVLGEVATTIDECDASTTSRTREFIVGDKMGTTYTPFIDYTVTDDTQSGNHTYERAYLKHVYEIGMIDVSTGTNYRVFIRNGALVVDT